MAVGQQYNIKKLNDYDEISKFSISNDIYDSWHQWGASQERLSKSMFIVERLYEQIISEYGSHDDMEEIDNES